MHHMAGVVAWFACRGALADHQWPIQCVLAHVPAYIQAQESTPLVHTSRCCRFNSQHLPACLLAHTFLNTYHPKNPRPGITGPLQMMYRPKLHLQRANAP